MILKSLIVSSLEKVFPDGEPRAFDGRVEGFKNENVSFQISWKMEGEPNGRDYFSLHIESPVAAFVRVRRVRFVPVLFPTLPDADDNYLRKTPGLYPDPITDEADMRFPAFTDHFESAWFDIECDESIPAGEYPVNIVLEPLDGSEKTVLTVNYTRLDAALPDQTLIHTKWFHYDGLCDRYATEMFSEKWWEIVRNYVTVFAKRSMNCLLTPIHTPPLDTAVGGERRTCQLVDVTKTETGYEFGFEKFERFVSMATECGVKYFEMAHLFTQWGAAHAPKIVASVNGEEKRIFGWETEATGEEYVAFLQEYLTALVNKIDELGIREKCIFHISDEPNKTMIDNYMKARLAVKEKLAGFPIVDALSDLELYKSGAVEKPVPANNHIKPFLDENIPDLWTYYCIGQYKDVANTFIAMPGQRTRILGLQMFKYDIKGFLQWGFNFYNSQFSTHPVNPFLSNDGDGFSPAGDCFQVYPGDNGMPIESVRMMHMNEAVCDMRALHMLASLTGKDEAVKLIEENIEPIEFDKYPKSAAYLIETRRRINRAIIENLKK